MALSDKSELSRAEFANIIVPICLLIIVALLVLTAYEWWVEQEKRRLQAMTDEEFSDAMYYNPTGWPLGQKLHKAEFDRRYKHKASEPAGDYQAPAPNPGAAAPARCASTAASLTGRQRP